MMRQNAHRFVAEDLAVMIAVGNTRKDIMGLRVENIANIWNAKDFSLDQSLFLGFF